MVPPPVSTRRSSLAARSAVLAVLLIVAALAPAPRTAQAAGNAIQARQSVPFTPAACPVPTPVDVRVDCGYLTQWYDGRVLQ